MEPDRVSISHSDYSDASVASLGPSIQNDESNLNSLLVNERTFVRSSIRRPHDTEGGGTAWYGSVFLLVNAALGAGLLNFPAAYNACGGLAVAIVIQTILALFAALSMLTLTASAKVHNADTYQDVVYSLCGRAARIICSLCIALYSFGACITFIIIIGDQWDKFLQFAYGNNFSDFWYMNRKFTTSITSVALILPICFAKRIDFLKYVSAAGVLAVLYCVALIAVKYFIGVNPDLVGPVKTRPDSWTQVFAVVPVICFGYQSHLSMVPIFSCTRPGTVKEFSKTISVSMVLCCLCYSLTGALGYLTFGSKSRPDILLSYDHSVDVLIAVILMGLKMYTTYPLLLFVGRAALDSVWSELRHYSTDDAVQYELVRRIVLTFCWFIATLILAIFIPDIGVVISYLGALAAVFIFIFPAICLLQLLLKKHLDPMCLGRRIAIYSTVVCFLAVGSFIFGEVVTQSILNEIRPSSIAPHVNHSSSLLENRHIFWPNMPFSSK